MSPSVLFLISALLMTPALSGPEVARPQCRAVCTPVVVDHGEGGTEMVVGDDFQYDAMGISRNSSAARSRERASHQWALCGADSRSQLTIPIAEHSRAIERYAVLRL